MTAEIIIIVGGTILNGLFYLFFNIILHKKIPLKDERKKFKQLKAFNSKLGQGFASIYMIPTILAISSGHRNQIALGTIQHYS